MRPRDLILCCVLVVAAFVFAALCYGRLPAQVPIHWNLAGQPDHYGPRPMVFIGPTLMAALLLLACALPWLSPRHFSPASFRNSYGFIMLSVLGLVGYLHLLNLWSLVFGNVDNGRAMLGGVAVCIVLLGNVMGKVRPNFWIGVRTPWTLASAKVWYATHRVAGKTMVTTGLLALGGIALGLQRPVCLALLAAGLLIPAVYSLLYYKQLERRGEIENP